MTEKRVTVSLPVKKRRSLVLRFKDPQQYEMVKKCAKLYGVSLNGWLVQATVKVAIRELRELGETT